MRRHLHTMLGRLADEAGDWDQNSCHPGYVVLAYRPHRSRRLRTGLHIGEVLCGPEVPYHVLLEDPAADERGFSRTVYTFPTPDSGVRDPRADLGQVLWEISRVDAEVAEAHQWRAELAAGTMTAAGPGGVTSSPARDVQVGAGMTDGCWERHFCHTDRAGRRHWYSTGRRPGEERHYAFTTREKMSERVIACARHSGHYWRGAGWEAAGLLRGG